MSHRECFDFVTDTTINESNIDRYLETLLALVLHRNTTASSTDRAEHEVGLCVCLYMYVCVYVCNYVDSNV